MNKLHYTKESMVKDLLSLIPFDKHDTALDVGAGKNKVWQKNCPVKCYECEIEDGCDIFLWNTKVDWCIGNPPYHNCWKVIEHCVSISNKGLAFLVNINAFNQFTPLRLKWLSDNGLNINKIHIVQDKRWFGRYYFIIISNAPSIISFNVNTY